MSDQTTPEQKTLYNLYALFGVSLVLCVVPYVSAAILCVVFFTILLISGYVIRGKAEEHSLVDNHATFIIRTLWIGALVSLITTCIASAYMLGSISYDPFMPCAEKIAAMGPSTLESMGMMEVYALAEPCVEAFISFNKQALIVAVAIGALPPLLYLTYRFFKGVSRVAKGYRLANPKSWF